MQEEKIYQKINYLSPIKYLINTYIREYDLSKANINSLLYTKQIDQSMYNKLFNMNKNDREVYIGLMIQKDRSIYHSIQKGIIYAKKLLIESNNLDEYDILSIKNDAVFVISKDLKYTSFGLFDFKVKNIYTVYMKLQDLEIYYYDTLNSNDDIINIDVKGIDDDKLSLHINGILDVICEICFRLQRDNIENTLRYISDIYNKYIHRELPKEYYREFDANSKYMIYSMTHQFVMEDIVDFMISSIDINRNLLILRDLLYIVSDIYNKTIKLG